MSHLSKDNKKLLTRVKKIKGQAVALENMLISDPECMAVLQQISAIKGAVNGLMKEVLESHLRDHLVEAELTQEQRKQEVEQVINVLKSYLK